MRINTTLRIAVFAALTLAASFSHAADQGSWVSTTSGCMVFAPEAMAKDITVSWTGHCSDGYAEGKGIMTWSNGSHYEGGVSVGMFNGNGTFHWVNGDWYQGAFKNGRREGFGTQHYACAGQYRGEFRDGVMDGVGVLDMADGNRYKGNFHHGAMEGLGTRSFSDGSEYKGEFKDNQEEGLGTLLLSNLANYQGEFSNNLPNGHALVTDSSGNVYQGIYVDGHVDGLGILTKPNGERDIGTFQGKKGTVKLVSTLGPQLYEPCQTHCSTTTPSCTGTNISAINPDDPNYQMKVTDASVQCGRDIDQCVTTCQRHNPTVRDLKGIVEIGELDQPADTSKFSQTSGNSTHDAKAAEAAKPAAAFADEQATATSDLQARLDRQQQQLQSLQVELTSLPRAAAPAATSANTAASDCKKPDHQDK